jgi:DNA-binding GntR family transcriptional regulator
VSATPWGTYARIAESLRVRFADAPAGAAVPSEAALAAEFGVARNTVRRALATLEGDGVIAPQPGRGRVVGPATAEAAFRRVAESLRAEITSGRLAPGDRVPSESELMLRYGVSRATVRRGLSVMQAEGLVAAVHGRGRFVDASGRH